MKVYPLLVFIFLIAGCSGNEAEEKPMEVGFTKFELCYTNGWDRHEYFCFSIDSTRHYNLSTNSGMVLFGILADSLFWEINAVALQIKPLERKVPFSCSDCSMLAALAVRGSDTNRHVQEGTIDRDLQILKAKIKEFKESGTHQVRQGFSQFSIEDSMVPKPWKIVDGKLWRQVE